MRWIAIGLAAALHVSIYACATETISVPRVPIASSSPSGLSLIWQNRELHPIGQPIAAGAAIVGIVTSERNLFVVGIDPATGRTHWQQPLTPSDTTIGEEIMVTPFGDDKVAYLGPISPDSDDAKLVIADVHTGKDLAASPKGTVYILSHCVRE